MANVKLKRKKDVGGYEQLYPQTLANNVITATGNVQSDISKLIEEINQLKNSSGGEEQRVELNLNCDEVDELEVTKEIFKCIKSNVDIDVIDFKMPVTPFISLGEGIMKITKFNNELKTVLLEFTRSEFYQKEIYKATRYINLLSEYEDEKTGEWEYRDTIPEDINIFDHSQWQYYGGFMNLGEAKVSEVQTEAPKFPTNKYLKPTDFNTLSTVDPRIFKEIVLEISLKYQGDSGNYETVNKHIILKRSDSYEMYSYYNMLKGRVDILFSSNFSKFATVWYRITTTTGKFVSYNMTLKIQAYGHFN